MEVFKDFINWLSAPTVMFTIVLATFFLIFPPTDRLLRLNRKLKLGSLWTNKGATIFFSILTGFFAFGFTDENFRSIVAKPDNIPIVGMTFAVPFFLWLSMKQAFDNDRRIENGQKPAEFKDSKEKILVWPDLVYIEFIALILCSVLLIVWGIVLKAPLEESANPASSPNPSKAPWYFLGLQEMLVYFDPWLAGVIFPTFIIVGLMAMPYIDVNKKGVGYYTFAERKAEIAIFMFGWLGLWVLMIFIGTFLRGPNWNFFGPFEYWDLHKLEPLTNVNLSEYIYVIFLKTGLPQNILLREMWGFLAVIAYFAILPPLFAKTILKKFFDKLGVARYSVFVVLLLALASLPIKMYLRWLFNLKYLISIPEFFFNI